MATLTSDAARPLPLLAFLVRELAPAEGRGLAVTRIAAACTITVAIAMVFRIPLAAYMAYIVFLISKDDIGSTVITAVGGALAVTLAVIFTLGLAQISLSEPAVRLPVMTLVVFLAMFSARTFALGPIAFLAGFIVVTMQSVVDDVPKLEIFTRTTLWLWVVVVVPVLITILINLLFGPMGSAVADRGVRKVLSSLQAELTEGEIAGRLGHWRATLVPLIQKAGNPAVILRLLDALVILEAYPDPLSPGDRSALSDLVRACVSAADRAIPVGAAPLSARLSVETVAATRAFGELQRELSRAQIPRATHAQHKARQMFVPDTLSNPTYWQFALKTTLAIMIVYSVYTMLDWSGLRTSIVTCFFVALGTLGETVHKLVLRLSGAIIGGLLAGLSIVFLLPHFTDIGQLCALTFAVALLAAWVATSSERLSYAGLQIAFAFFLGILQTYAPATDLTVLRDRVAGIVLGNVVMTLVFSTLWPESAIGKLRGALAQSLRAIASLLRSPQNAPASRQQTIEALEQADNFETLSAFEIQMLPRQVHLPDLHSIERLAGAAFVAASDPSAQEADARAVASLADWLDRAAQATIEGGALPAVSATVTSPRVVIEAVHVASSTQ
jgi:multidrug resistance protein MdtO